MIVLPYELNSALKDYGVCDKITRFLYAHFNYGKKCVEKYFTNHLHYTVFKHLPALPDAVMVSREYAVFVYDYGSAKHCYLFGLNSDQKLFINKLLARNPCMYDKIFELDCDLDGRESAKIPFFRTNDEYVRSLLGYEVDIEGMETKEIPQYDDGRFINTYRVQGDLVFVVEPAEFYNVSLRDIIANNVERILERICLERIAIVLQELGLSFRLGQGRVMVRALPSGADISKIERLGDKLIDYVVEYTNVSDFGAKIIRKEPWNVRDDEPEIAVQIFQGRREFGRRFRDFVIEIRISDFVVRRFVDHVMNDLDLSPSHNIIRFGRHLVRYHGYPQRFIIFTRLVRDANGEDQYVMQVQTEAVYVSGDTIYVYHPEHGQAEIAVKEPVTVAMRSTFVDSEFEDRLNYYTLKSLPDLDLVKKLSTLSSFLSSSDR